jgi:ubiquinone/menaquinone biosynthesis C-methylase UbiE
MLDHLRGRLETAGIGNVEVVHTTEGHVPVADHVADMVFAAFVLHEANDPAGFLVECARLVKPHGAVVILEWRHEANLEIRADHRIAVSVITELASAAGLDTHVVTNVDDERVLVRLTRRTA